MAFQIPFELIVAFATNLDPSVLADEAFLRRVPNKIYMGPVTGDQFDQIFERVLERFGVAFDASLAAYLRSLCAERNRTGLRACYPRDICEIMLAASRYKRRQFHLNRENLESAVESYFTHSEMEAQ